MKDLKFKLKTKTWPVTMENAEGQEVKYEIRELRASARDKYVDKLQGRLKLNAKGQVIGLTQYAGMQADLLTICMHTDEGKLVDKPTLDQWPGTNVQKLFHAAQTLNGFREVEERNKVYAEELLKFLQEKVPGAFEEAATDIITATELEEELDEIENHFFGEAEDEETEAANKG